MNIQKEILFISVISFIIGAIVAAPVIALEKAAWLSNLLKSGLVGLIIGIIAGFAFMFFYKNVKYKTRLSFLAVLLVIGIGTLTGAYILGVRNLLHFAIMVITAELIGLILTFSMYRYNLKLNNGLLNTQKKYTSK